MISKDCLGNQPRSPLERSQRQFPPGPADAWEAWAGGSGLHTGIFPQSLCSPCTHSSLSIPMVALYGRIKPRQLITRFPGIALQILVLQEIKNHTQRYLMFPGWRGPFSWVLQVRVGALHEGQAPLGSARGLPKVGRTHEEWGCIWCCT